MRNFLIILSLLLLTACESKTRKDSFSAGSEIRVVSGTVYICTGNSATKYHSNPNCSGLNRCSGTIEEVSTNEAENMGRRPCKRCY